MSTNALTAPIIIRRFQPADQPAVKALVLAGLVEHWGFLDPTKNPDLDDIAHSYAGATFLIACQGDQIVGCGALIPRPHASAEIVRMSVAAALRRQGVGRRLLEALAQEARQQSIRRLVLETTQTWQEVIRFYLDFGFTITHYHDGDVYFALDLPAS